MKRCAYSCRGRLQVRIRSLSYASLAMVFVLLGCGFEPKFDTPDATVQTYVWAYNHNDEVVMKKCGYNADLYKLFRIRTDLGIGEPTYDVVRDIKAELQTKEWARPKATRRYTTDRILLLFRFTSRSDPTFDVRSKLLLVKRRSRFTDLADPIRWQLMSLENALAEDADTTGTPFD